jgi:stage V sporulation protein S
MSQSRQLRSQSTQLITAYVLEGCTLMVLLKVASTSRTASLAGAIAGVIRQDGYVEVQSIGAGAVNQAIKALTLANSYLKEEGIQIAFTVQFVDVAINEKMVTGIKFLVEPVPSLDSHSEPSELKDNEPFD